MKSRSGNTMMLWLLVGGSLTVVGVTAADALVANGKPIAATATTDAVTTPARRSGVVAGLTDSPPPPMAERDGPGRGVSDKRGTRTSSTPRADPRGLDVGVH